MIVPVSECGFAHDPPVFVYAIGPEARGPQLPPYGVGEFVGWIVPTQMSECKTKRFKVRWTRSGTYHFVLVQKTNPGWRISRSIVGFG